MIYEELKTTEILFKWQEDAYYTAKYAGNEIVLEMRDFPAEHLWNIYLNQKLMENVNDLPPDWTVVEWMSSEE